MGKHAVPPRAITAASVAFFALLGLALRVSIAVGVEALNFGVTTTEPSIDLEGFLAKCREKSSGSGYFLQNVIGCILMAAIARHKKSMNEHLAVGLASGLCGSLTTFATWMGEEAVAMRNGFVFESFVSLTCMLCVCLCSYRFGHFMAGCGMGDDPLCFDDLCGLRYLCCRRRGQPESRDVEAPKQSSMGGAAAAPAAASGEGEDSRESSESSEGEGEGEEDVDELDWGLAMDDHEGWFEPEPPKDVKLHPAMETAIILLSLALIVLYASLCAALGYTAGLLDLAMAPFGALLRWYLSLHNASATKACYGVPVFTLLANTLGCVCNAFPPAVAARGDISPLAGDALRAVSTGFAGCLSTVSTLIGELRSETIGGLRVRSFYFLVSFGLAMAVELPIKSALC